MVLLKKLLVAAISTLILALCLGRTAAWASSPEPHLVKNINTATFNATPTDLTSTAPPKSPLATTISVACDTIDLINKINDANNDTNGAFGADTLELSPGCVYNLTTVDNTTDGDNGLPVITTDITINGNGATIQRDPTFTCPDTSNPDFRIFYVNGTSAKLTINDLTVANGCSSGSSTAGTGGGIRNFNGTVIVNSSTITNNATSDLFGGAGINSRNGLLTIVDSTFANNKATRGSSGVGGGVALFSGTLSISGSTFNNNAADSRGSAVDVIAGTVTITNSTLSGNNSGSSGDVIYNQDVVNIINSTIINNSAGIRGSGQFSLTNSILANNGSNCLLSGTFISEGYNFVDDASCPFTATGDQTSTDPLLAPLADNGGQTLTHAPLTGSLALDQIPAGVNGCGTTVTTDQRGVSRPQGSRCDIGAVETITPDLTLTKTATPAIIEPGQTVTYTLNFSNTGDGLATGVVLTDFIPSEVTGAAYVSSGATLTETGGQEFAWQVEDLSPGESGLITITGQVDPNITSLTFITNTATITSQNTELDSTNNRDTRQVAALGADTRQVYVMSSGNSTTDDAVMQALLDRDHLPTLGVAPHMWDGTQAILTDYEAVVLLNSHNYALGSMPATGQSALLDYVSNGGGLVTGEWLVYNINVGRHTGLEPLVPVNYEGFTGGSSTTYSQVTANSIINNGLPANFTFSLNNVGGSQTTFSVKPGAVTFYDSIGGGVGLAGWTYSAGRVASFSTLITHVELSNANYARLLANSIEWVSQPDTNLTLIKIATPATAQPGQTVTYTLTFSNASSSPATNVVITDDVPAEIINLTTAADLPVTKSSSGHSYQWELGELAANQSGLITITGQIDPAITANMTITNTATITGSETDSDPANNRAEAAVSIQIPTDLTINKTVTPALAAPGDTVTYTLTYANAGSSPAANVVITDDIPAQITVQNIVADPPLVQSNSGNSYRWDIANLGANQGGSITIKGQVATNVPDTTTLYNEAFISSPAETNPANNSAGVGLTVVRSNQWLTLDTNTGLTLDGGDTEPILPTMLHATDPENGPGLITYTVWVTPQLGSLLLNGTPLMIGDTFTQDDLDNNRLSYAHTGLAGTDSFTFTVSDDMDATHWVSIDSAGAAANGNNTLPAISADGRYVAFGADATNLVSGDTNGLRDIFVHDRRTGQTERVSVSSTGAEANGRSGYSFDFAPAISADGRFVAFDSEATNLVSGDTNGQRDIFVHDRQTGQTERVSINSAGEEANNRSEDPALSADGRFVAFTSFATNLAEGDTSTSRDVFVHDRQTGQTEQISLDSNGQQANNLADYPSISADGRFVAFRSRASNLVSGDTTGFDIFMRDRQTGQTEGISVGVAGQQDFGAAYEPSVSASGRYVAFRSPSENSSLNEVFVHDRQTGQTESASISFSGDAPYNHSYRPAISADGRYVVFDSQAGNFVPGDNNGLVDVFVHDRQTDQTRRASVDSAGNEGGAAGHASTDAAISADGRYIAFRSSVGTLVSGDSGHYDIFVRDQGVILANFSLTINAPITCYATPDDGTTVFSSADTTAVQQAVDAAAPGGTVKVAGTCAGVQTMAATDQSVYIDKSITIRGGYTTVDNFAVSDPSASPTTIDAQDLGRVVYISGAGTAVQLENLRLIRGSTTGSGGAVATDGDLTLHNSTVLSSSAQLNGGGVQVGGIATIENSRFEHNQAGGDGGALYLTGSGQVVNGLFVSNTALSNQGAALALIPSGSIEVINATMTGSSLNPASAIYSDGNVTITNSIITTHAAAIERAGGTVAEDYNLFFGNTVDIQGSVSSGGHSLSSDPFFSDPGSDDYRPVSNSPAIDAGDNTVCPATDLRGEARSDLACDIGAYERQLSDGSSVLVITVQAGQTYSFGPTLAEIEMTSLGTLASLEVELTESDHPQATAEIGAGRYWTITALDDASQPASGYEATLTLPVEGTAQTGDELCRYDEVALDWDCTPGAVDTTTNRVTRSSITEFSDWAVGRPTRLTGDVNCDGELSLIDVSFIFDFTGQTRSASNSCPASAQDGTLYEPACDGNGDGQCTLIDASLVFDCTAQINNVLCPASGP